MKEQVKNRIASLQLSMKDSGLDAALIYDRENLIYFAGVSDLEGGVLCIPAEGEPELYCLAWDGKHMKETCGIDCVIPYPFPKETQSLKAAQWLKGLGLKAPKVGFTKYFITLKDYQCLMEAVPGMVVGDLSAVCYRIRSVKSPEEIALIRQASGFLSAGMEAAVRFVRPGVRETEVLAEAEYALRKAGSEGASFRMQVLGHKRQMLMHPYAGNYELGNNEPVVIHLGSSVSGYVAKMCRTVFLGEVQAETKKIYRALIDAQKIAVEMIRPGVLCGDVYDAVYRHIDALGYGSMWMDYIGYGVGIRQSEFYPILARGSKVPLQENMVIDLLLPTVYKAGVGGPRITDTILVTADGGEYLTDYRRTEIVKPF
jgi:Xaa-Pro aminopeptidase